MSISNTDHLVLKARADGARQARREAKKYRAALTTLTCQVMAYLAHVDVLLAEHPDKSERGSKLARLSNALEMENDKIRYFALGIDFRTDKKLIRFAP